MSHEQIRQAMIDVASPSIYKVPNGQAATYWYNRQTQELVFIEFCFIGK